MKYFVVYLRLIENTENMTGKLLNGKIVYHTPIYNSLSGGSWENGWSRTCTTGGDKIEYDYEETNIEMIEGYRYKFELENNHKESSLIN
jgi:hypothetical protein